LQSFVDAPDQTTDLASWKVNALHVLAIMRLQHGDPKRALELLETAQTRYASALNVDTAAPLRSRNILLRGLTLHALGKPEAALQALSQASALHIKTYGAEHPGTLFESINQARTLWVLGRTPDAIALLDHALPVLGPALGADSPSYLRMVKLRELMIRSPVPDSRTAKAVDLFL
jgi:tetratricopeptide (TPR) repeat protein